jgi:hypothetical protein
MLTLVVARDRRDVISKCICGAVLVKVLNNIIDYHRLTSGFLRLHGLGGFPGYHFTINHDPAHPPFF